LRRARDLPAQHRARRERDVDVADHDRALLLPRRDAQRAEIGNGIEVAVPFRPARERVAGNRVHLHVAREEVIAGVHAVPGDVIEKILRDATFADEPPVHVGENGDDGLDLAVSDEAFELVESDAALHDWLRGYAVTRLRGYAVARLRGL